MTVIHHTESIDILLRMRDVCQQTGLSKASVYRHIESGSFPRATQIVGVSRWSQKEVQQWISAQLARRVSA